MVNQEYETKILNVDRPTLKITLHKLGFICSRPRHFVRRWVFSLPNKKDGAWVRIIAESDTKDQLALAYKYYESYRIGGIHEYEFVIGAKIRDVQTFFELLGCSLIAEQHTYEEQYRHPKRKNIKIEIDEWPLIPLYVEIEGKNKNEVMRTLIHLGFNKTQSQPITTKMVYKKYGLDLHAYKKLSFKHTPTKNDPGVLKKHNAIGMPD